MESGLFEAILFRGQLNCDWKTHLKVKSWGKRWRNRPFWDQTAPIHDLIACKCRQFKNQDKPHRKEKGSWTWESFQEIWKLCPKRYFIRFLRNTLTKIFSLAKLVNVKWRPIANCWPTMTLLSSSLNGSKDGRGILTENGKFCFLYKSYSCQGSMW